MFRYNPDRDIRDLERLALSGDLQARALWEHELFRRGQSLKNIDNEILLARLDQWFTIVSGFRYYLSRFHFIPEHQVPVPSQSVIERWKREITDALSQLEVDRATLGSIESQLDSWIRDLSNYLADRIPEVDDRLEGLDNLSDIWEEGGGIVRSHIRGLLRFYGSSRGRGPSPELSLTWDQIPRDHYNYQDELADIMFELTNYGGRNRKTDPRTIKMEDPRGRLKRRGPPFMAVVTPRTGTEVRLPFAEFGQHAGDVTNIYRGQYGEHVLQIEELEPNEWHVRVDGEDIIEQGELGEFWQDAVRTLGEWLDDNAIAWLYCSQCRDFIAHPDACDICNTAEDIHLENIDEDDIIFPKHACVGCARNSYPYSAKEVEFVCHRHAAVCGRCKQVACKHTERNGLSCSGACKECGVTLCGSFDCGPRCFSCDAEICWECQKSKKLETEYGSSCSECLADPDQL